MKIIAKAKKNQKLVNQAVKALIAYNTANDLRDKADGMGDEKAYNKHDRQCQRYFDKYLEIISELPKTEVKQIESPKYGIY